MLQKRPAAPVWIRATLHQLSSKHLGSPCPEELISSYAGGHLLLIEMDHPVFISLQLIEDLRKELEHLQLYKLDCERPGRGRSSSSSVSEFNARTREVEMEHEIKRLKQVSRMGAPGLSCSWG